MLDIYKGLLIILVVIRHVLQYSVTDEGGILTNTIWTIQMPGFMLVSGYFSARSVENLMNYQRGLLAQCNIMCFRSFLGGSWLACCF